MFDIYKFEFDCGFIDAETVKSYVAMGILSQDDCDKIVGDGNEREAQPTASNQPPTTCYFGHCYDWYWLNSSM